MNNAEKLIVRRRIGFDFLSQAARQLAAIGLWLRAIAARPSRPNPDQDDRIRDVPELLFASDKENREFAERWGRPRQPGIPPSLIYIHRF